MQKKSFLGSKAGHGTLQKILSIMPKHKLYIEGYLGSGAIIKAKQPAVIDIGTEINRSVIDNHHSGNHSYITLYSAFIDFMESRDLNYYMEQAECISSKDVLIYLDPPYMRDTRTSNHRYQFELLDDQHEALLQWCTSAPFRIAVSCYDNDLYRRLLADWHKVNFSARTRGRTAVETIYMNYNPSNIVRHNHDVAGISFTDRQRIKRKQARILSKFNQMSEPERQSILAVLIDKYRETVTAII